MELSQYTNPDAPPERIFGWSNSQLSLARYYGRITCNGAEYVIAYDEEGQPLVRVDVIKREAKEARKAKKRKDAQGELTK